MLFDKYFYMMLNIREKRKRSIAVENQKEFNEWYSTFDIEKSIKKERERNIRKQKEFNKWWSRNHK